MSMRQGGPNVCNSVLYDFGKRGRFGKIISLRLVTSKEPERFDLCCIFDPFGGHFEADLFSHIRYGSNDCRAHWIARKSGDELAINLNLVEGYVCETAQACVTRSKIIESKADAAVF